MKVAIRAVLLCILVVISTTVKVVGETGAKIGAETTQTRTAQPKYMIVYPPGCEICTHMAERLGTFIERACGKASELVEKGFICGGQKGLVVIAIGAADDFENLNEFEVADELAEVRRDGYVLKSVQKDGGDYILALGQTEKGAVNAVWRLMREMDINNGAISVKQLAVTASPFFRFREVMLADPWNRSEGEVVPLPEVIAKKYCWMNWDEKKLRSYIDLLDSFGYNSVQTNDVWIMLANLPKGMKREDRRDKITALANQARRNGQTVSLFIYGSCVKDFETGKEYKPQGACFLDPVEREVLIREYDWQANSYGSYVDRIITHWCDWGGCNEKAKEMGTTIRTACKQHNTIVDKFREKNPNIESSFSLWYMTEKRWPGYNKKDDSPLSDIPGPLPADVTLAVTERMGYIIRDMERIRRLSAQGRKVGVWGWRLNDLEVFPSLHVHTDLLETSFRALPPDAGEMIDWYSVDDVAHIINMTNLYVTGQLMWNPRRSTAELLREFTKGAFGKDNAEKMAFVLEIVEKTGCFLCPNKVPDTGAAKYTRLEGLKTASSRLELVRQAKTTLAGVKIAPDFIPPFPLPISPSELLEEIAAQLEAISALTEFQVGAAKLVTMKKEGASLDALTEGFLALPKVTPPQEYLWQLAYQTYVRDHWTLHDELELEIPAPEVVDYFGLKKRLVKKNRESETK